MHHQITSSSHHPHPESPFKSKSGKNTDLFFIFYLTSGQNFYWSKFDIGLDQTFKDMGLNAKFIIEKLFLVYSKVIQNTSKMFDPVLELVQVEGMPDSC